MTVELGDKEVGSTRIGNDRCCEPEVILGIVVGAEIKL